MSSRAAKSLLTSLSAFIFSSNVSTATLGSPSRQTWSSYSGTFWLRFFQSWRSRPKW
ncbi:hypothetical protein BC826DRAFT_1064461, partial [Russula brevipes]